MTDKVRRREIQKKKLRNNMIDPDAEVTVKKRTSGIFLLGAAVLILLIAAVCFFLQRCRIASGYESVWANEDNSSSAASFRGCLGFSGGMVVYSKDGAEYIDGKGNNVWQKSYQMTDPIAAVRENYCVIADRGGTGAYIFNTQQSTGAISTVLPISLVTVSAEGIVYAVLNDDEADFIRVYRKDGSEIDITVKSVTEGDGYPLSVSTSPDGSELVTSYVSIGDGTVTESVVFRNFGDVGQNEDARRVVGGFMDDFENHLAGKVSFADNEHAHAFYDGGIVFFSTKVLNSPSVLAKAEMEEEILSVADDEDHSAVIVYDIAENTTRRICIYDNNGKLTGTVPFELNYTGFVVGKKNVVVYNSDRILSYSLKGRQLADIRYEGQILSVQPTSRADDYLISENGGVRRIRVK